MSETPEIPKRPKKSDIISENDKKSKPGEDSDIRLDDSIGEGGGEEGGMEFLVDQKPAIPRRPMKGTSKAAKKESCNNKLSAQLENIQADLQELSNSFDLPAQSKIGVDYEHIDPKIKTERGEQPEAAIAHVKVEHDIEVSRSRSCDSSDPTEDPISNSKSVERDSNQINATIEEKIDSTSDKGLISAEEADDRSETDATDMTVKTSTENVNQVATPTDELQNHTIIEGMSESSNDIDATNQSDNDTTSKQTLYIPRRPQNSCSKIVEDEGKESNMKGNPIIPARPLGKQNGLKTPQADQHIEQHATNEAKSGSMKSSSKSADLWAQEDETNWADISEGIDSSVPINAKVENKENCQQEPVIPPRPSKERNVYPATSKPPPKPKKLSSKIAAFQQMLNNAHENDTITKESIAEPTRLSNKTREFANNLNLSGIPGRGIPLPGIARTRAEISQDDLKSSPPSSEMVLNRPPSRSKGPKGKRLPQTLKKPQEIRTGTNYNIAVSTLWDLRLTSLKSQSDSKAKLESAARNQSKELVSESEIKDATELYGVHEQDVHSADHHEEQNTDELQECIKNESPIKIDESEILHRGSANILSAEDVTSEGKIENGPEEKEPLEEKGGKEPPVENEEKASEEMALEEEDKPLEEEE